LHTGLAASHANTHQASRRIPVHIIFRIKLSPIHCGELASSEANAANIHRKMELVKILSKELKAIIGFHIYSFT